MASLSPLESRRNMQLSPYASPRRNPMATLHTREAPLEGREAEAALISATLANAQLRASQAAVEQRSEEVDDLREARDALEREMAEKDEESQAAATYFEKQMTLVKEVNRKLKEELVNERATAELRMEEVVGKMQEELQERDNLIATLKQRLEDVESDLRSVIEFRDARDAHEKEIKELRVVYAEECENHQRNEREMRLQCMEERVRLREKEEKYEREREEEVARLARSYLSKKTRAIEEQNKSLETHISFLSSDADAARNEAETLQKTNNALRRDAELASSVETMHAVHHAKQRNEIALLRDQVRTTEDNLNSSLEEYEKRLQKQEKIHAAEMMKLSSERDKWRSTAENLRADLLKMRSISEKLIEQRSDMETFFHRALEQVRQEVSEERRNAPHKICFRKPPKGIPSDLLQLTRGREPLMIGDRSHVMPTSHSTLTKKVVDANVSCTNSSVVSRSADTGGGSLPLITMSGSPFFSPANVLVPPIEWRSTSREMQATNGGRLVEERPLGISDLLSVPTAPKIKDLHTVDISQLSWSDKERVLQLLFKHMKRGATAKKTEKRVPTHDTNFLSITPSATPEVNTFLTD
ncbi:hypothetical protein, conserved [Trypanosoma brucei gambiense DAL972]|uniref:Uncharacterized protein n=1 Tax=Trypanosoma brucei gambiense (strain MHOM/CI/86/DAL972) TaxID=679716 RepID=D0A3Y3_TRYB9|nr:hypothetical protein, conserved [Trypanosoma brucei gambiense DAL972]CBH15977.1 hypothetical protein, conserved [Trypanosoma brucei gambiense DAL972]|eukprot:XP_011778241.1 hypothetical protein, conserved [Trypanosoma brucei gambiense DAL972]